MSRPEWFAPRRYGIGAGFPIAWQGWLVMAVFIALLVLLMVELEPGTPLFIASIVAVGLGIAIVTALTTRGGWRWRWGERD